MIKPSLLGSPHFFLSSTFSMEGPTHTCAQISNYPVLQRPLDPFGPVSTLSAQEGKENMFSCHSTSLPQRKAIIFIPMLVLFLQSAIPLLIRHTRKSSDAGSVRYHPAFVTCLAELVKAIGAFIILCQTVKRSNQGLSRPQV
jgi:hypothetical protein